MKKFFSYSEYRAFIEDQNKYYLNYVMGVPIKENEAMKIGKIVHKALADDIYCKNGWKEDLLKETSPEYVRPIEELLQHTPRYEQREKVMFVDGWDEKLMLIVDGENRKNGKLVIADYKTTKNTSSWNKARADQEEQFTFYAWCYGIKNNKLPDAIHVLPLNIRNGKMSIIETKRIDNDVARFEVKVRMVIAEIKRRGWWEKRKSRQEMLTPTLAL